MDEQACLLDSSHCRAFSCGESGLCRTCSPLQEIASAPIMHYYM